MYKLLLISGLAVFGSGQSDLKSEAGDAWLFAANDSSCSAGLHVDDSGDTMLFISYNTIGDTMSVGFPNSRLKTRELSRYDVTLTVGDEAYEKSSLGYDETPTRSGIVTPMSGAFLDDLANNPALKIELGSKGSAIETIELEDSHGAVAWLQDWRSTLEAGDRPVTAMPR